MNLDLVLGISCNISSLTCDSNSGLLAYPASGVLVILDTDSNCQVSYLQLHKNSISSANISRDGRFVVTGEIGFKPAVRVWRLRDGQEVGSMYGHGFGIKSVLFSPSQQLIVSVGLEHDNEVNVWTWPEKLRVATNKIADVIHAVAYADCNTFFVTAGNRHLKFWYPNYTLDDTTSVPKGTVRPLYGRPGILGDFKNNSFTDVACGNGASSGVIFVITKSGSLAIVGASDRHMNLQKSVEGKKATCVEVQDLLLILGFSSGLVHMFNSVSLTHLATLPVPTFFRNTDALDGSVFTMRFNTSRMLLTSVYKNSSLCVWDLKNSSNITQKYLAVYHDRAITDFDLIVSNTDGKKRETLITASHDSTVRMWGICSSDSICYDSLSILYTDGNAPIEAPEVSKATLDKSGLITAVKVSPDYEHVVTGNTRGDICVYLLQTYQHILTILAHNREITCLCFYSDSVGRKTLVSGSRDRLIHIMDANREYRLVSTLYIHSSSITNIRICRVENSIIMASSGSDRSLVLCTSPAADHCFPYKVPVFQLSRTCVLPSSPADLAVSTKGQQVLAGCHDGYVRVYDMAMLHEKRCFKGCRTKDAQIYKICLDSECILLLVAASDKIINIYDFSRGELLYSVAGHTRTVTGLVFTHSLSHVITTSMDGCVFLWRLSDKLRQKRNEIRQWLQAHSGEESRFLQDAVTKGEASSATEDSTYQSLPDKSRSLHRQKRNKPLSRSLSARIRTSSSRNNSKSKSTGKALKRSQQTPKRPTLNSPVYNATQKNKEEVSDKFSGQDPEVGVVKKVLNKIPLKKSEDNKSPDLELRLNSENIASNNMAVQQSSEISCASDNLEGSSLSDSMELYKNQRMDPTNVQVTISTHQVREDVPVVKRYFQEVTETGQHFKEETCKTPSKLNEVTPTQNDTAKLKSSTIDNIVKQKTMKSPTKEKNKTASNSSPVALVEELGTSQMSLISLGDTEDEYEWCQVPVRKCLSESGLQEYSSGVDEDSS